MEKNIQCYDNGLPYKPIIYPSDSELIWVEKEQVNGLCIYLSDESVKELSPLTLKSLDLKQNELWADFGEHYVVVRDLSEKTIECLNGKELLISFFTQEVKTLLGLKVS